MPHSYIRDPGAIYRQSFEAIRREVNLSRFPSGLHDVVVRLIHACGMVDIVDDLAMSDDAAEAGRDALMRKRPIVCDVEMVRHGIIRRLLPPELPLLCGVADEETAHLAQQAGTTRSAAAFERLAPRWAGGIAVIGNAPTALFHLLDLIEGGAEPPALIVGIPVGFVGAAESKDALAQNPFKVPYITVRGRRGGSAMAAAAMNGVAGGLRA